MDDTQRAFLMQRWSVIQHEWIPELRQDVGALTPKLEKRIHTLEWVRIEALVTASWCGIGRPPHERAWLANAFVAQSVLGLATTAGLIERLAIDRTLRRICGFPLCKKRPSEATFVRAFEAFAESRLAERTHEALVQGHLGGEWIGHLSRDGTAIEARERPAPPRRTEPAADVSPATPRKRGRPRRGDIRPPAQESPRARQRRQTRVEMISKLPTDGDRGTKCNAQGYKVCWNGYKLHRDTADCGVPISALLSSASMHDSRAAIPLSRVGAQRVTNLYDLMDAAYACSHELREDSRSLGHVPLIDHNPRGAKRSNFNPAEAGRYHERTAAE